MDTLHDDQCGNCGAFIDPVFEDPDIFCHTCGAKLCDSCDTLNFGSCSKCAREVGFGAASDFDLPPMLEL
jgi:DNA-directed RNA polymerase subunit RPC12/RpoP